MAQYGEIQVRVIGHTDNAVYVEIEGHDRKEWIPWSVIENNGEDFKDGYVGRMYVETWKLNDIGVDYEE